MKIGSLQVDSTGTEWARVRCDACGEVHSYPPAEAKGGSVECRTCHRPALFKTPVVEAAPPPVPPVE